MSSTGVGSSVANDTATIGAVAAVIVNGRSRRKSVLVQNVHASNDLYVGGSSVTTANGVRVRPGESTAFDDFNGSLYGIASGAGTDVRYLEVF